MAVNTIPKREEIPEEYTWNLADMYADDAAWSAEYEALKALPERIAAYAGRLGEGAQTLLEFFRLEDEADVRLGMLLGYASCKSDQDTGNAVYLDMRGKAVGIYVASSSAAAFATPEIIAIPEEKIAQFFTAAPELGVYRRSIYRIRRMAALRFPPRRRRCWPRRAKWRRRRTMCAACSETRI